VAVLKKVLSVELIKGYFMEIAKRVTLSISLLMLTGGDLMAFDIKGKIGDTDSKLQIFGFGQLEARGGDGVIKDNQNADVKFQAQRIRMGWKYSAGAVKGKIFVDFNKPHTDKSGVGVPDMIKDAFGSYRVSSALAIKLGILKMPIGMSFTIPGWNLDVVERGFDKALVFERNMGLMISGRDIGFNNGAKVSGFEMGHERPWRGFGYDIMVGNQAGRSGAVTNAKAGDANSYAVRVMFDWGEIFHSEASYGVSKNGGGIAGFNENILADTEDYRLLNFGVDSHLGRTNLKAEYFNGENLKGVDGWDESVITLTGTYYVTDKVEFATKYIQGSASKGGEDTDLTNTYIGVNYYLQPVNNKMDRGSKRKRNRHRVQLNYVVASGDKEEWGGLKGYRDDAILAQYQFKF
jgi:hypothetical protein